MSTTEAKATTGVITGTAVNDINAVTLFTWLEGLKLPEPYKTEMEGQYLVERLEVAWGAEAVTAEDGTGGYRPVVTFTCFREHADRDGFNDDAVMIALHDEIMRTVFIDSATALFVASRAAEKIIRLHDDIRRVDGAGDDEYDPDDTDWYEVIEKGVLAPSAPAPEPVATEEVPDTAPPHAVAAGADVTLTIEYGASYGDLNPAAGKKPYYAYAVKTVTTANKETGATTTFKQRLQSTKVYPNGGSAGMTARNMANAEITAYEESAAKHGYKLHVVLNKLPKGIHESTAYKGFSNKTSSDPVGTPEPAEATKTPPKGQKLPGEPVGPTATGGTGTSDTAIPDTVPEEWTEEKGDISIYVPKRKPHTLLGQDTALRVARAAVKKNDPVLMEGHTGCGKTLLAEVIAHEDGVPMLRLNLNGQTGVDEFVGRWLIKDGSTYWVDGALTMAMRYGWYLLLDEINAALPEICFVLQTVLDDARYLRLAEKDNEIVHAHPRFRVFAGMNPTDEYAGTKELNHSLRSRFKLKIVMDYPAPTVEQKILINRTGCAPGDAAVMVEFATRVRNGKRTGSCFVPVGTRDLLAWAEYTVALGNRNEAFQYTVLNNAGTDGKFFADQLAGADKLWKEFAAKHGKADIVTLIADAEAKLKAVTTAEEDANKLINDASRRIVEMLSDAEKRKTELQEDIKRLEEERTKAAAEQSSKLMEDVMKLVGAGLTKSNGTPAPATTA